MEMREFRWPMSAIYSRVAELMEPVYPPIARGMAIPPEARRLLEVGAGDGRLAVALARTYPDLEEIVSTDIAADMAKRIGRRAEGLGLADRIRPDAQDVQALTYPDSSFDAVVSLFSMHHWRRPAAALRELDRVLKPGGLMAVVDGCGRPSIGQLYRDLRPLGGSHVSAIVFWIGTRDTLSLEEIEAVVRDSGLGYIETERAGPTILIRGEKPGRL
jgi:ubiquinone/menaquinone biosynthesis C-methylase UbiE